MDKHPYAYGPAGVIAWRGVAGALLAAGVALHAYNHRAAKGTK